MVSCQTQISSLFVVYSVLTHHRLGRKHLPEQTARRAEEEGDGQSLPASGSFRTAWTDTPAPGETPVETEHEEEIL